MDFWSIIFLVAAGQGIFLAFMLMLSNGRHGSSNSLLGIFLLLFSLNMLENVAYWTGYQFEIPHVIGSTRGFVFLFGPLLWLYTRGLLQSNSSVSIKDGWHLIPFVFYTLGRLPFYLLNGDIKRELVLNHVPNVLVYRSVETIICLHMAIYAFLILKKIKFARINTDSLTIRMIKSLFIGFSLFTLSTILYYVLVETIDFQPEHDYFISLAGSIAIYQVGYFAFMQPEVLHGFSRKESNKLKYENSPVNAEEAKQYYRAIQDMLKKEKIYLTNDLRLADLANKLAISPNYVSQVINEHFGKTFFELINSHRVEEAKQQLEDPVNNDKLLAIALNSGFNNRTSFNTLFKKHTGVSPKEYRAQVLTRVLN